MKRIQRKDAILGIRGRLVSWLSIVTIMMIGTAGILGIRFAGVSLLNCASAFLERQHYKDFDMVSNVGVSTEDLTRIRSAEGVADAEGIINLPGSLSFGGDSLELRLYSPTERVSVPVIEEGRAPEGEDECALCRDLMEKLSLSVGDRVRLRASRQEQADVLKENSFSVTGIVAHPDHVTRELEYYALLSDSAFDRDVLGSDFTNALVDAEIPEGTNQLALSYFDAVSPTEAALDALRPALKEADEKRLDESLRAAAEEQLRAMGLQAAAAAGMNPEISVPEVSWVVQNRNVSASFLGLNSSYQALASITTWFTPLFAVIALMVCFSTVTIIVEEQKSQIGTLKALGMNNAQVRAKFLLFGISATVIGELLGFAGALAMEEVILGSLRTRYLFGHAPITLDPALAGAMLLATTLLASAVVFLSCNSLIRCPAIGLINGSEPKPRHTRTAKPRRGGIYFNLILSNMRDESARVLVSVVIVLESVLMIGTGITMRQGLAGALDNQLHEIWLYDMIVEADAAEETAAEIETELGGLDVAFLAVHKEPCIASGTDGGGQTGVQLFAVDGQDERFRTFFRMKDTAGVPVALSDSGLVVTEEMREKDGFSAGSMLLLLNSRMANGEARVTDVFMNHIGKYIVLSAQSYEELFGTEAEKNCWLLRLNGADETAVREALLGVEGVRNIERSDAEIEQYQQVLVMYNLVVVIIILMVIALAFMIQLNLCNIQVSRRMRELLVLRVNGFSMRQVVGYLIRETVLTSGIGILLGILLGVPFASFIVRKVEVSQIMFVRTPFVNAWVISAVLCAAFSLTINAIAFRRIRDVPLTNLSR